VERRLAAILAADVAGYSRLMTADEAGTLARLNQLRTEVIEPKIKQFHGRIVGSAGDSLLIEFGSAVNAVECAVQIQASVAEQNSSFPEIRRMSFRIGVNLGDVIAERDTIYGEGVNIAARLEKLAEPGGVCISRNVHDQVKGKIPYTYAYLGEQRVHNIPHAIQAYKVLPNSSAASTEPTLPLPDKPSIAVLPFQNMSGDAEQEYFADGMVEEIITALSRFHSLFVIARNSSFTYKGRAVDVKQVGRELGVRYVLEGSIRKAGNRVRITGQLIDCATGTHLWADRFDGGLEDIFDLQEKITTNVVGAIAPKVEQAELQRSKRKPTESLDAYDYYLRGLSAVHEWSQAGNIEAISCFKRAIELDPNFAAAYGFAARCYSQRKAGGWMVNPAHDTADAERLSRRAAELGWDDALALCTAGVALAFVVGDLDSAMTMTDRAVVLNPNLDLAWHFSGWVKLWSGQAEDAIERFGRAIRLSPNVPHRFTMQDAMAAALFVTGRYDEAFRSSKAALREKPDFILALCIGAASAALCGRRAEAQEIIARLLKLAPATRISNVHGKYPELRRPEHFAKLAEGLRKAGLPE
jgi:TolB-like protein/Tfp pilus assembly protein PilF